MVVRSNRQSVVIIDHAFVSLSDLGHDESLHLSFVGANECCCLKMAFSILKMFC